MKKFFLMFLLAGSVGLLQARGDYSSNSTNTQGQPVQGGYSSGSSSLYSNGSSSQYGGSSSSYGTSGSQGAHGAQYQTPSSQFSSGAVSDEQLRTTITETLKSHQDQGKYKDVTADVSNGSVTLKGTVNSKEEKDSLGSTVGGIAGVKSVNNQLTVKGSDSSSTTDSYSSGDTSIDSSSSLHADTSSGYTNGSKNNSGSSAGSGDANSWWGNGTNGGSTDSTKPGNGTNTNGSKSY